MPAQAQVSTRRSADGGALVSACGEFDLQTADQLRQGIVEALDTRPLRLVVDLAGVTFMDSMGLRVLVGGYRVAGRRSIDFAVTNPSPFMRHKLHAVGLASLFALTDAVPSGSRAGIRAPARASI